jgi:hypothetical protein
MSCAPPPNKAGRTLARPAPLNFSKGQRLRDVNRGGLHRWLDADKIVGGLL